MAEADHEVAQKRWTDEEILDYWEDPEIRDDVIKALPLDRELDSKAVEFIAAQYKQADDRRQNDVHPYNSLPSVAQANLGRSDVRRRMVQASSGLGGSGSSGDSSSDEPEITPSDSKCGCLTIF